MNVSSSAHPPTQRKLASTLKSILALPVCLLMLCASHAAQAQQYHVAQAQSQYFNTVELQIDGITAWNDVTNNGHQLPPSGGGTGSDVALGTQLTGDVFTGGSLSSDESEKIQCWANGTQIYTLTTNVSGEYFFNWTPSATGTYTVYCSGSWSGTPGGPGVSTPNIYVPVVIAPTITSLSPSSGLVGTSVTIAGANFGASKGTSTVTFNGTAATISSWSNTSIVAVVPSGATTGSVVVTVGGVASNGSAFTVLATPTISVTSSGTPSTYGNSVTFTAAVTSGDTNTVTFYSGSTSLGTATPRSGTAALTTNSLPVGSDSITATIAAGGNYTSATSSAITQVVNQATPTISVATSGTPSANGSVVTFTATISNGVTGTVTFYDSGIIIGSGGISGSTATFSTSSLALGTHTITAGWAGNTSYYGVISSPLTQTVVGLAIYNVSPNTAMIGDLLELNGTGFGSGQGSSTITIDGLPALAAYWSDQRAVVEVPAGASAGAVKITVNSFSSSTSFSVAQPGSTSNTCN